MKVDILIKICDVLMGGGKTSYIIQLLKERVGTGLFSDEPSPRYLVATPYLDQINELISKVPEAKTPLQNSKNKTENLIELLRSKTEVIICTHELLKGFSAYELLEAYVLIIDESPDVIEVMYDDGLQDATKTIAVEDIEILKKAGYVRETEDKFLEWVSSEYQGVVYADIYKYLKNKSLAVRNNRVYKLLPREAFFASQDVYIFTYLFEGQDMYYYCQYFNIPFEYFHIVKKSDKYKAIPGKHDNDSRSHFPITIYEGKLNEIGEKGLSKNWYQYSATGPEIEQLKSNIYNYLRNDRKAKIKDVIWTTFKQYSVKISNGNDKLKLDKKSKTGAISKGNFVSCTARATNNYKNATVVVYAVNRFPKPEIKQFWEERQDIAYNDELFALQEMIQFIWRSAIREGQAIHIYIPSKRMRDIFKKWLTL